MRRGRGGMRRKCKNRRPIAVARARQSARKDGRQGRLPVEVTVRRGKGSQPPPPPPFSFVLRRSPGGGQSSRCPDAGSHQIPRGGLGGGLTSETEDTFGRRKDTSSHTGGYHGSAVLGSWRWPVGLDVSSSAMYTNIIYIYIYTCVCVCVCVCVCMVPRRPAVAPMSLAEAPSRSVHGD
ncbi:hypothetical protein LX36DRAFT_36347 [Colletotrichum falcatum]|nr:hypothetical protein LX36DRAFT_36347 [Colletotrichum falcatum]